MTEPRTLADKLWDRHRVLEVEGEHLLYVDRLLVHEGSSHAFAALEAAGRSVFRPRQVIACSDHYLPSTGREKGVDAIPNAEIRNMVLTLRANAERHGIVYFGPEDRNQGILHVVAPELGITQPGLLIAGADSHTTTHGAFGCLAFGIGASDAEHVLATQTFWLQRPETMRVWLTGYLRPHITAKDIDLAFIAKIGAGGAIGHIIEFAGPGVAALSMEQRMTLCNMAVEAGGRAGLIAPDQITYTYIQDRPASPRGEAWEATLRDWRTLFSDPGAHFDREVAMDLDTIGPFATWGTSPEHAASIDDVVPDPATIEDQEARKEVEAALSYMGLSAGMPLSSIAIDRVFIGSCTNSRIEDLRAAAAIARHGRAVVPTWVVPGSQAVKRQAEEEGLDAVFHNAGFEWRDPGCSLCTALNGDALSGSERCASTSNRNFRGRQGSPTGRTHLLSPAMAAAAAITGKLTDVRQFA